MFYSFLVFAHRSSWYISKTNRSSITYIIFIFIYCMAMCQFFIGSYIKMLTSLRSFTFLAHQCMKRLRWWDWTWGLSKHLPACGEHAGWAEAGRWTPHCPRGYAAPPHLHIPVRHSAHTPKTYKKTIPVMCLLALLLTLQNALMRIENTGKNYCRGTNEDFVFRINTLFV